MVKHHGLATNLISQNGCEGKRLHGESSRRQKIFRRTLLVSFLGLVLFEIYELSVGGYFVLFVNHAVCMDGLLIKVTGGKCSVRPSN